MPPFGRLVGILISAQNSEDAFEIGYKRSKKATILSSAGITLYGPAPAPITRVRGRYRVRMLLKASKPYPCKRNQVMAFGFKFKKRYPFSN